MIVICKSIGSCVSPMLLSSLSLCLSQQEVGSLVSDVCDDVLSQDLDSDSDNFSVEFEVESIDSDAYSDPEEASVSGEDEVSAHCLFNCVCVSVAFI